MAFDPNVSESIAVADAPLVELPDALAILLSESIAVADTPTLAATRTVSDSESVAVADTPALSRHVFITFTDTIEMGTSVERMIGDYTEVRNHPHTSKWYMAIKTPRIIWKGRVPTGQWRGYDNGGDPDNDQLITITGGANEAGFDVTNFLPDLTVYVGSTDEAKDHGTCRVRSFDGSDMVVSADMSCMWNEGDYISITDLHQLWPMPHKIVEEGGVVVVYKDTDLASTNREEEPVCIMGSSAAGIMSGGSASIDFYGGASYRVQPNSDSYDTLGWDDQGIASYAWWFEGGTPSTSVLRSQTVTYSTAGQYVVRLTCTDDDTPANTYISFRNVYIFDANNPPITKFNVNRLQGSLANHGWEAEIEVFDDSFDPANVPNDAEAVLFADEWFDGAARTNTLGYAGTQKRSNIKMVGWLADRRITYSEGKIRGATMVMRGLQKYLIALTNFPVYWTMIEDQAPAWSYFAPAGGATPLTVRKTWYHTIRWHWTLMRFTDVYLPDEHNNPFPGQNFPEGSFGSQADAFCKDTQSRWAVDRTASLRIFPWPNWLPITGDGAVWREDLKQDVTFTDVDLSSLDVEPRIREQVAKVRVEGVASESTGSYSTVIATAPGDVRGYKGGTITVANQVLGTGERSAGINAQGYELAQMVWAEESRTTEQIMAVMAGNYSLLDIVPPASYLKLTINPSSVLRTVDWTDRPFWVTEMEVEIDPANGDTAVTLTAMPETQPPTENAVNVWTESESVGSVEEVRPTGGSGGFQTFTDDARTPGTTLLPALMGTGANMLEGPMPGTTWVRLFGELNHMVLAENREFQQISNRPILVEEVDPARQAGKASQFYYRIAGLRQAKGPESSTYEDGVVQHSIVFNIPGSVAAANPAAPSFLTKNLKYQVKELSAYAQGVTSGPIVVRVLKGGGAFGSDLSVAGARTEVTQTITDQTTQDGDYWDLQIVSGTGTGLTVQVLLWLTGI